MAGLVRASTGLRRQTDACSCVLPRRRFPPQLIIQAGEIVKSYKHSLKKHITAFTLVELLVVLVILAMLSALTLAGLATARANGRIAKTRSTIRKISEIILPYYESYETRRPVMPSNISSLTSKTILAELRRIALRRLMAMELPERSSDITNLFTGSQSNSLSVALAGWSGTLTEISPVARRYRSILSAPDLNVDTLTSADLLQLIVFRGPVADPDIISHFRPDEIADTNENGIGEFVDGWNNPIYFKRWPVGFDSPTQPIDGKQVSADERVCRNGHRLVPLLYSAGVDGEVAINDIDMSYAAVNYDPFSAVNDPPVLDSNEAPTGAESEVVIYPVTRSGSQLRTYVKARRRSGNLVVPASPDTGATVHNSPRLAIGSELGTAAKDNIHNHDMTR